MNSVSLWGTARGGQALIGSPIDVNGITADGAGVLFHESIGLMYKLHCNSSNQGQDAYEWYC
jgi:hypothetical protein